MSENRLLIMDNKWRIDWMIIDNQLMIILCKISNINHRQINAEISNQKCIYLETRNKIGQ